MKINDMQQPLITIVIPIFNVEQYLGECVQSVRNQSYHNLEIILVDDGSPDNCPKMCDEYANQDCRIKVIHKENGGLSDARNAGIDIATGEYIAFIDSDDYIHEEMIEVLYKNITQHNADISMCTRYDVSDDGKEVIYDMSCDKIIGDTDIEKYMIMFSKGWSACIKLFKMTLFKDMRFPKGILYEDFALVPKLFVNAKRVIYTPQGLYYYRMRNDSIMRAVPQSKADLVYNADENMEYLNKKNVDEQVMRYVFKGFKNELNAKRMLADKSTERGMEFIEAFKAFEKKYTNLGMENFKTRYCIYKNYAYYNKIKKKIKGAIKKIIKRF